MFCIVNLDGYTLEELTEQVSRLSMSLSREDSHNFQEENARPNLLVSESLPCEKNCFTSDIHSSSMEDIGVQIVDSKMTTGKKDTETVIILSDDEVEPKSFSKKVILSVSKTGHHISDGNSMPHAADNNLPTADSAIQNVSYMKTSKEIEETLQKKDINEVFSLSSQKPDSGYIQHDKPVVTSFIDSKGPDSCRREVSSTSKDRVNLIKFSVDTVNAKKLNRACSSMASKTGDTTSSTSNKISDFQNSEDDPLETALKSVGCVQSYVPKPTSVLRRQVIQLRTPLENRASCLHKLDDPAKRFKPARLDDWYKPILEIDYFAIVGLSSARKDENRVVNKLKEVPVYFQSPEQYVEIFRPLVLEEFKAQLQNSFLEMSSWEEMSCGSLSVMSVERIDDFHLVRFVHDDGDSATGRSFSENDFVLLTKDPPQKSSHDVHMVGKVYCSLCVIYLSFL